jgi:hypothetical protein
MSFGFSRKLPALGRGFIVGRRFHLAKSENNKNILVSIMRKEKAISLSWSSVENTPSYQIAYKPASAEQYNLLVSSRNSTVLNNLSDGVAYQYTVSPVTRDKELLAPIHSGTISLQVGIFLLLQTLFYTHCYCYHNHFILPLNVYYYRKHRMMPSSQLRKMLNQT